PGPTMVRSLPRVWSWAPVSRSISFRLAFRSPKSAKATRLSSNVSRSVTVSLNLMQIACGRLPFNALFSARAGGKAPRFDAAAGQADRRGGDQAGRSHAAPPGPGRLPLGSGTDAGDPGAVP